MVTMTNSDTPSADKLAKYFKEKIENLRNTLPQNTTNIDKFFECLDLTPVFHKVQACFDFVQYFSDAVIKSTSFQQVTYQNKLLTMKFLVPGAVHFLLLCHLRLVVSRALPVNPQIPICENLGWCGNHIMEQLRHQLNILNSTAKSLYETYKYKQQFDDELCRPTDIDFPSFHMNGTHGKERMVELYKVFIYMNASLGNITRDQNDLNPEAKDLLTLLRNTTAIIRGVISNLTCLLCEKYKVTDVDVVYGRSTKGSNIFNKKKQGCEVLRKYMRVIDKIAQVTRSDKAS
ncbi:leukemia inhibitory factor [Microcaecilia unicolor]|uniref:Leukemia inhibitory factor n=1 Tax=Microcaecilia unicolor TaxID=1415580 RepID=A0A6P7Z439_9AMPH|nr:leukemia inhibitory factor [Microcaecilia unicolor]